jgi:hypothetical protein
MQPRYRRPGPFCGGGLHFHWIAGDVHMHEEPAEVTTWLIHNYHATTLDSSMLLMDFDVAKMHTEYNGLTENPASLRRNLANTEV